MRIIDSLSILYGLVAALISPIATNYVWWGNWDRIGCCVREAYTLLKIDADDVEALWTTIRPRTNPDDFLGIFEGYQRVQPNNFNGIWWMEGNPAQEVLATMADSVYREPDEDDENEEPDGLVQVSALTLGAEGGTWAYNDNFRGRALFVTQCVLMVSPNFSLNPDQDEFLFQGSSSKSENAMSQIDIHTYSKPIIVGEYALRRILDENGQKTSNWDMYAKYVKDKLRRPRLLTFRGPADSSSCVTEDPKTLLPP